MEGLERLGYVGLTVANVALIIIAIYAVSESSLDYQELFAEHEVELPFFTRLMLYGWPLFMVVVFPNVMYCVVSFLSNGFDRGKKRIAWSVAIVTSVLTLAVVPLFMLAMYLPVFKLGGVI